MLVATQHWTCPHGYRGPGADRDPIDCCSCVGALFMLSLIFLEFIQTRLLLRKMVSSAAKFGTLQQTPSSIHDRWLVVRVTLPMAALR